MKRICLYLIILLTFAAITSCDNEIGTKNPVTIDPEDLPMFQFDAKGIPYRYGSPFLSTEMQDTFKKEAVGYGWKWMQTNEILENGYVSPTNFYEGIYGLSPSSYLIKSSDRITRYFYSDAINTNAFWESSYSMDFKTGTMSNSDVLSFSKWDVHLRIWSIYKLSGKWYMDCIEPLCERITDDGQRYAVWGTSHYTRMTDAELKEVQNKHTFDYSLVN